jgi:hypothetical protein
MRVISAGDCMMTKRMEEEEEDKHIIAYTECLGSLI